MKGVISIIEVMLAGIMLVLAFAHFFPQYMVKSKWDKVLLELKVRDTLNTIDGLNKTYNFTTNYNNEFNQFIDSVFTPETSGTIMYWREFEPEGFKNELGIVDDPIPNFHLGYKDTIVDVVNTTTGYHVYSFTLGLGYPY